MKFSNLKDRLRKSEGFTIVETIVAISVFLIIMAMASDLFTNSFFAKRKTEVTRMLYEESRILLERVVKEVRRGTIDYEEYWNRYEYYENSNDIDAYGKNYGDYARQFYRDSGDSIPACDSGKIPAECVTRNDENVGENGSGATPLRDATSLNICTSPNVPTEPEDTQYEQCELYLINAEGDEKTILKLEKEFATVNTSNDATEYHLTMLKLPGIDSNLNNDGEVDTWKIYNGGTDVSPSTFWDFCSQYDSTHECTDRQFQKIQPDSINITSLVFHVAPLEDPRKAFAEFSNDIQQQPHVTIELTAQPSAEYLKRLSGDIKFDSTNGVWTGNIPTVTLQTTVGARAQNEVKSIR